ncbi:flavodoxin family protein [Pseudomonas sp. G11-1]|uniref:Flavodoxin family protein n=1 Tax=Halopseudomonas bauzanensis TaxID=653930 RepID=A0A031MI30_9GAMM|nr:MULTISPECIES: flavodoxin family protein [Halopseudomonas]MCO5785520.1 flavodoxin family protein [Pseudomonas sp. G11-1]MCO5788376.1 flavodoxin family protein [Pseudomonas sp. G11-2]EZQ19706.1 flavodoxin [Halopseudomonas bauzanensis]TKA93404.1 flavodoxin family protein [Halopseudomonas bauzanensis]WGK61122.1 flavodoxin family protein [Halopseudomonas sp. SMJS2]
MSLTALALNCTLKPSPADSSCDLLLKQTLAALQEQGAQGELLRVVDYNIKPGVTSDEGDGDDWPMIRQKMLAADILILGTPVWLGHPSSLCQRVLERLDALLSETDDQGRMLSYGKVAGVAVVGNEDGAHHIVAQVYQGLNDVGFTLPANSCTYWVGEAMGSIDFKDLPATPDKVVQTTRVLAQNCVHLARLLKQQQYPAQK